MSPARRRGSPRCAGPCHDVPVVSAALLVWPLEELDTGWTVEVDALLVVSLGCVAVVPAPEVVVCGSGVPAKVTAPSAMANVASVAAATRRWMRVLEAFRGVEGMQAACARVLSRGSAPPGRSLSVRRAPAR